MTFQEMYDSAKKLGIPYGEMVKNCQDQRDQYYRLSSKPSDKWAVAAQQCEECLVWLAKATGE